MTEATSGSQEDFRLLEGEYPQLGKTSNAQFYVLSPRVLAILPNVDSIDDESSSRESIALQERYFRSHNLTGGSVIFIDRVINQTRAARQTYKTLPSSNVFTGFAIVTQSVLGRAVSSLFLGLSATQVPTRVFPTLREAVSWLEEKNTTSSTSD